MQNSSIPYVTDAVGFRHPDALDQLPDCRRGHSATLQTGDRRHPWIPAGDVTARTKSVNTRFDGGA